MFKNVASQKYLVFAFNRTTNNPMAGDAANITAKLRKDSGTATATNDANPTEIEDGFYEFDLTQAETNADVMDFLPESSTSDIQVIGIPARVFAKPANLTSATLAYLDAAITTRATPIQVATEISNATLATSTALAAAKAVVDAILLRTDVATSSRSVPGDAMTLTSGERSTIATSIEAELANDATGEALKEAIIDKLIENLPDLDDLTIAAIATGVRVELTTELARMDAAITTRATPAQVATEISNATLATSTALAAAKAVVDAILLRTDVATSSRSVAGDAMTLTSGERSTIATSIEAELANDATGEALKEAIIDKLIENLPDLDDLTIAAIATGVRVELTTELARMDAAISSRFAAAGYTAPDNASAAAAAVSAALAANVLDALTEDSGGMRFTEHALEAAPAGAGGGDCPTVAELVAGVLTSGAPIRAVNGTHIAADGSKLYLVQGEAYLAVIDNAIEMSIADDRLPGTVAGDGTTTRMIIKPRVPGDAITLSGSVVSHIAGVTIVRFEMTAAQSATLPAGIASSRYDVEFLIAGNVAHVITSIVDGICTVRRQST